LGTLFPFLNEVSNAQLARGAKGCMSSANLGVVFAPCTLYSPSDPTCGATSAPIAFKRFIDNCDEFRPREPGAPDEATSVTSATYQIQQLKKQLAAVQISLSSVTAERDALLAQQQGLKSSNRSHPVFPPPVLPRK